MVVVMAPEATDEDVSALVARVEAAGGEAFVSRGVTRTVVGLVGDVELFGSLDLRAMRGVLNVMRVSAPYKLVAREHHPDMTTVYVGPPERPVPIGPDTFTLIAGPCAVESHEQTLEAAQMAAAAGRDAAARRRVQAEDVAVRLPGTRRGRAADPRRRGRGDRAAGGDRGGRRA